MLLISKLRGVRNEMKSRTRFGIFTDSRKIQGFAPDSAEFTKNYGIQGFAQDSAKDSWIRSRFSKRFRDSLKIQQEIRQDSRDNQSACT